MLNAQHQQQQKAKEKNSEPFFQPKLTVNQPGDAFEKEADAVADSVMRMAEGQQPFFKPSPYLAVQRKCNHCEEEEKKMQRKETGNSTPGISREGEQYINSLNGKGCGMQANDRTFFESRMGYDLSNVRLHNDAQAHQSASSLNALAYTHGNNIVFGAGQYQPGTDAGKRLMAHELTHTIQQSGSVGRQVQRQVNQVEINCGTSQVNFNRDDGATSYSLDQCDVTDGEYEANVNVTGNDVRFSLRDVDPANHFNFHYAVRPGQPNPSTFFAGQAAVHIRCTHDAGSAASQQEIPVTFVADEMMPVGTGASSSGLPLGYGGMMGSAGLSTYIYSLGNLSWLNQPGIGLGRGLSPELWRGLLPRAGLLPLDRTINLNSGFNDLITGLGPRIENEGPAWLRQTFSDHIPPSLGGTGAPLRFTLAELQSLPDIAARLNAGGPTAVTPAELLLLRRAVSLQGGTFGGSTVGSPLASYSEAGSTADFLSAGPEAGETRYRVRVEVDRTAALDTTVTNDLTAGESVLMNAEEAEFMVVANSQRRIVSVQRIPAGGAEPGWVMRNAGALRWGGRILLVGGVALSGYRIATATPEERPRVVAQEGGGWGGGLLGTELGAGACIAFGIATEGVGLLLCGLAGGIGGGVIGSSVMGAAADGTWGSSPTHRYPDGTWYDRSGNMHMGAGPKW